MDKACAVQGREILPQQKHGSRFYVSYALTCDRSYPGPVASRIQVRLKDRPEQLVTLNYKDGKNDLYVGEGLGPLELVDTFPEELKYRNFSSGCSLVFHKIEARYSPTVSARIDFLKQRIAEIDQLLPILDGGLTSFEVNIELFSQVSKLSKAFAESARGLSKATELGEIAAKVDSAVDQAIDKATSAETVDGELISSLMDLSKLMTKVSAIVQVTGDEFPVDRIVTPEELQAIDAYIVDVEKTIENLGKLTFDSNRKITDLQNERAKLERERLNY
jgi:hypothetical protein